MRKWLVPMIVDENFDRRTSREGHGEGTVVKITVEKYTKPVQSDDYLGAFSRSGSAILRRRV